MLFSEEWLRSVVNPDLTSDELAEAMTMAGLEVEDCSTIAPLLKAWWLPKLSTALIMKIPITCMFAR